MDKLKDILLDNDLVAYVNDYGGIESILDMSIPIRLKPSDFDKEVLMKYQKKVWKQLSK